MPTMTYFKKVLVMVGSKIIDQAMGVITKGEVVKATTTWRQTHFGAVMSGLLQLSHSNGAGVEKEVIHSSLGIDTIDVKVFCLDNVQGPVCTTQRVTILLFSTVSIQGTLYVGSHAGGANTRSPVAYISGANCDL